MIGRLQRRVEIDRRAVRRPRVREVNVLPERRADRDESDTAAMG